MAVTSAGVGATGCGFGQSCDFDTKAIKLVAEVVDDGITVRAEASFRADEGAQSTAIELCEDDTLTINGDPPIETIKLDRVAYSVTRDFEGAPRNYTFELVRSDKDEVVETQVVLPAVFEILDPAAGETLARSEETHITWDPPEPEGEMQIEVEEMLGGGICVKTEMAEHDYKRLGGIRVEDSGSWKIPPDVLTTDLEEPCEAAYKLTRSNPGEYPEAFQRGGFVEGRVQRTVGFELAP